MSRAHYFYFPLTVSQLEKIITAHQLEFDHFIQDSFSDEELAPHEKLLDDIAAVYVQPILSELTFDDFYAHKDLKVAQQFFFESCRSSIALENLPYFQTNPFQVSYLIMLLNHFDEFLVDQGGVSELVFKKAYILDLHKYKTLESLFTDSPLKIHSPSKSQIPVNPIDFLIQDVYREIARLRQADKMPELLEAMKGQSEKRNKIFLVMKDGTKTASELLRDAGLIPKDFDDHMEGLKFFLKKMI